MTERTKLKAYRGDVTLDQLNELVGVEEATLGPVKAIDCTADGTVVTYSRGAAPETSPIIAPDGGFTPEGSALVCRGRARILNDCQAVLVLRPA